MAEFDDNDLIKITLSPDTGTVFFNVTIEEIVEEEGKNGVIKEKKIKHRHLVQGHNPTEVEKLVKAQMSTSMNEWQITSVQMTNIELIYS